jgi:hypothetical protein
VFLRNKTEKSEHDQNGTGYHQPIWIFHSLEHWFISFASSRPSAQRQHTAHSGDGERRFHAMVSGRFDRHGDWFRGLSWRQGSVRHRQKVLTIA